MTAYRKRPAPRLPVLQCGYSRPWRPRSRRCASAWAEEQCWPAWDMRRRDSNRKSIVACGKWRDGRGILTAMPVVDGSRDAPVLRAIERLQCEGDRQHPDCHLRHRIDPSRRMYLHAHSSYSRQSRLSGFSSMLVSPADFFSRYFFTQAAQLLPAAVSRPLNARPAMSA